MREFGRLIGSYRATTRCMASCPLSVQNLAAIRVFSTSASSASSASASSSSQIAQEQTHFGFQTVQTEKKKGMVAEVFHRVADQYDLMNDVMSAGVHRLWKDAFIADLAPQPGMTLLDVAGGTGDIAFRFLDAVQNSTSTTQTSNRTKVIVSDINPSMLQVGKERATQRGLLQQSGESTAAKRPFDIDFLEADAENLPLEDNSVDAYTISFGLRNVTDIPKALSEARRVLRPGGRFMCLEFSRVETDLIRSIYDAYSFNVIPEMGRLVMDDRDSYQYLVESIRQFPPQKQLKQIMSDVGFKHCTYTNMTDGVVAIHSGFKL